MTSGNEKIEVLPEPIKSASDKKLYKTIRLENGLTALLISDSGNKTRGEGDQEKLAACALSVGAGSYSNPPDIQGLAHFVEHMVFMGNEKYPKENEFDSFTKINGGFDNAYTDSEITTFYFEIQENQLPQAMDMFSQFFVSPLMLKEAMQREREAIQSEFSIASPRDANRRYQLLASMFPEGHPAHKFSWGNLRSLKYYIYDDDELYNDAHDFHKRHYSAHRMTVAVQARMDLASLEQYVTKTFGQIPTNNLPADDFSQFAFKPDAVTSEFKNIYYVKPVSDTTEVHLTWNMRSFFSEYESKPDLYVSYLMGHEGKGSLLSYLREKVWALGIYTGTPRSGIGYTSINSLFSVQVVLTKDGLDHIDEVIESVFSYISMLKKNGPSENIYNEIKTIEETSFRFEEESEPSEYVEALARNMHLYPSKHYISGNTQYYKYDPKGITQVLECMSADSVNIMILSNKYTVPIQYDEKEKWFGTDYKRIDIPPAWLHKWLTVEPYEQFHLPDKNIYLTTNFDLVPYAKPYLEEAKRLNIDLKTTSDKEIHKKVSAAKKRTVVFKKGDLMATVNNFRLDQPNLFRKNRNMELWYKPDFKFNLPTAFVYLFLITPLSLMSPRDACLLDLWTDVLQQGLKEDVYPAQVAYLTDSLFVSDNGLTLQVTGYNQNLHLLVDVVTRKMRNSTSTLTRDMFEAVREERARTYHNMLIDPYQLSTDVRMNILAEPYISSRDKAMIVHNITLSELKDFTKRLLGRLYLQVLVQGNLAWYEAIKISEKVLSNIKWKGLSEKEMPKIKVHQLPLGERVVRVRSLDPASTVSIVTNYYQGEKYTVKDMAKLELLVMLMDAPLFDTLRTKEQLGYSVFSMMRYTYGVLGYSVTVYTQVDKFSVSYVEGRVEAFLQQFTNDTGRDGEAALADARRALVQAKLTPDYELKDEVERNWGAIANRDYQFQTLYMEAEEIEKIKLADIMTWMDNHFATGNKSQFRKLSVQIVGNKPKDDNATTTDVEPKEYTLQYLDASESTENSADFIKDVERFKKDLPIIYVPIVKLTEWQLQDNGIQNH